MAESWLNEIDSVPIIKKDDTIEYECHQKTDAGLAITMNRMCCNGVTIEMFKTFTAEYEKHLPLINKGLL